MAERKESAGAARQKRARERKREAGLVSVNVWVKPEYKVLLREVEKQLQNEPARPDWLEDVVWFDDDGALNISPIGLETGQEVEELIAHVRAEWAGRAK